MITNYKRLLQIILQQRNQYSISQLIFLSMELSRQPLLNIQLFTDPITHNFRVIQNEFTRVHKLINDFKQQSHSFRDEVQKFIAVHGPTLTNIMKRVSINQSAVRVTLNETNEKAEQENNAEQQRSISRLRQDQSLVVFQNTIESSHSILNDISNTKLAQSRAESRAKKDSIRKSPIIQTQLFRQQKRNTNNRFQQAQRKAEAQKIMLQINSLKVQINQLSQVNTTFQQELSQIQIQNQNLRKSLGLKKKPLVKQKTQKNLDDQCINLERNDKSKKTILHVQEQPQQEVEEMSGFRELYNQLDKIRDYLNGKMKAVDANFGELHQKITKVERNVEILDRTGQSIKYDLQALEKTANQTKLNLGDLHDKSMIAFNTKSKYRKNINVSADQSSILGDQSTQINVHDVQDRIIELLQEMQKIKAQYHDFLFVRGAEQGDGSQKEVSPQVLQRRKKLAIKLNGSDIVDQKMKKDLSSCRRELRKLRQEFDYLMNGVNTGSHETKTLIIKPNQTKQDWKSLTTKIYKAKQQLQGQIKQLQGKITSNNQLSVVLNELQVGIEECKIISKRKLDILDFQKTIKRIQNRMNNFIRQTFQKQGSINQQDATIAKQSWFCLSCDVQLKTYSGKIKNPSVTNASDKFVGKKVNPESHMVRRNQNGRLPSLGV